MIVADTSAILALVDADDKHHRTVRDIYQEHADRWLLPWAILPEVDYLLATHVGTRAEAAFLADLADGRWMVEWGDEHDLQRAHELCARYAKLKLGLTDGVVMAVAERSGADAIVTLDIRHFGVVKIKSSPRLLPRDRD